MKHPLNAPLRYAILTQWNARYRDVPPIGYLLKSALKPRWARVHTLPDAKRYADTAQERAEIARRQNMIITDLIGADTVLRVLISSMGDDNPLHQMRGPDFIGALSLGDGEPSFDLFTYETTWTPPDEALLAMCADDQMKAILIGPDCVIAPYDGGVDVIFSDAHTAFAFKRKYKAWMSPRHDGL
jgi:hypothetical protein